MEAIKFTVTIVEERTRITSAYKTGPNNEDTATVQEKYWCVVLDPGRIAMDFGVRKPELVVGDKMMLRKEIQ